MNIMNYWLTQETTLKIHRQSVHLNIELAGSECGKELASRANLTRHMKNVYDNEKKLSNGVQIL